MTQENSPESRLLNPTSNNEETRRSNIRDWLFSIGVKRVVVEHKTGAGKADIYLPNKRVIIEVKEKGKADDPHKSGTGSRMGEKETAFQQLSRYLESERKNEQRDLDDDDDENIDQLWIGIVTDSQTWWIWEWNYTPKVVAGWDGTRLRKGNIGWLSNFILNRKQVGKEWVPEDPTDIFRVFLDTLRTLYKTKYDERAVITQKELWYRQLEISGNQPDVQYKDELFVLHTLLIAVSTKISAKYGNESYRYGFASWVEDTQWLDDLSITINRYNWKRQTGDVLRTLYMGLVDKAHRHIYGEYYTPDWLAEKLCAEVIDDDYIERWINGEDAGGVMDPACGSGTFLYHTVRHIIDSNPVREATMDRRDLTDMIVRMIHGIDIHPVAVAMAKANILRILPDKPGEPLSIYQGDSLQTARKVDDAQQRIDEVGVRAFSITSREGANIRFPLDFIMVDDFDKRMHQFARAAAEQNKFPPRIDENVTPEGKIMLKRAFDLLTKVCFDEGNGIWAWYVIQYVGVYKLKNSISRIITNPPWVILKNIQNVQRKREIENLAKALKLWVGGTNAPNFDVAMLFVKHCSQLYKKSGNNWKSGWILPDAAMRGGNWEKYINDMQPPVVQSLGSYPFPEQAGCCVNIFGVPKEKRRDLILKEGKDMPRQNESWDEVEDKTEFVVYEQRFEIKESEWLDGKKTVAHAGARFSPSCLLILDNFSMDGDIIKGRTETSRQDQWKGKSFDVEIPKYFVRDAIFSKALFPYGIGESKKIILPIDDYGDFLPERVRNEWWNKASDKYRENKGKGSSTPQTLEARLTYLGGLETQFPFKKNQVIYNTSGNYVSAARLTKKTLINDSLYRIPTKSKNEALFLTGMLNADIMQERFRETKKAVRHFHKYFWYEIPIPRYNVHNRDHVELANLVLNAEKVVKDVERKDQRSVRKLLREDGISAKIDKVVERIMTAAEKDIISD